MTTESGRRGGEDHATGYAPPTGHAPVLGPAPGAAHEVTGHAAAAQQASATPDEERLLRMALSAVLDGGDLRATTLVHDRGAQACWAAIQAGRLGPAVRDRAAALDLGALHRRTAAMRFVIPGDSDWPAGLDDLAEIEPRAEGRGGVPIGLWLRGPADLAASTARSVAIVGARACTAYGERVAHDLGYDLAAVGVTVVSGLALGVDAAAHRGALAAGGVTLAALAGGADVPYPRQNAPVYRRLVADQLVFSEVAPGGSPTRVGFLARNRLIAAMSRATVLVEAAARSGARNTVGWASALGRPVCAVPGSVESSLSDGPHAVIRDRQGELITGAADVLELIDPLGQLNGPAGPMGEHRPLDDLDPRTLAVYEALPGRGHRTAGEVALAAGTSVVEAMTALARLDRLGLAALDERGWALVRPTAGGR